jgi:ketopantoate reductase
VKTLIYGAGPIGRWLALRLQQAGQDVILLARNETLRSLDQTGIETPDLDALLACVARPPRVTEPEEVPS